MTDDSYETVDLSKVLNMDSLVRRDSRFKKISMHAMTHLVTINSQDLKVTHPIYQWCEFHCGDNWIWSADPSQYKTIIRFIHSEDAMMFKLKFGVA